MSESEPSELFWRIYFHRSAAVGLGATQIMLGVISIIFGTQGILSYAAFQYVGHGIWAGFMCLVSGAVAVAAGARDPTRPLVVASMSLSIISLLFALAQMSLAGVGVYLNYTDIYCTLCENNASDRFCTYWISDVCLEESALTHARTAGLGVAITGLVEFCVAVGIASLGCGCFLSPHQVFPEITSNETNGDLQHALALSRGNTHQMAALNQNAYIPPIIVQVPPMYPNGNYQVTLHPRAANAHVQTSTEDMSDSEGQSRVRGQTESLSKRGKQGSHIHQVGEPPQTLEELTGQAMDPSFSKQIPPYPLQEPPRRLPYLLHELPQRHTIYNDWM